MLEIAIIITIAIALFLLLRNYSKTKDAVVLDDAYKSKDDAYKSKKESKMFKFWQKYILRKKQHEEQEIIDALRSGQSGIVSPKEIEQAQDSFDAADPEVAKLLVEANDAFRANDFKIVEEKSIEAIAKDKHCDQAYAFVAKVAIERKDYSDAEEACKTALQINQDNALAHSILGDIYLSKERYTEAIIEFQRAVNLDRNNALWQAGLGKAYMQVRQFSKAAKALKRASSLDIDSKEYRELAFEAEEKQRAHAKAFRR